jgi:hypothetical protein
MKMTDEYSNGMYVTILDPEEDIYDPQQYSSLWQKQQQFHELYLQDGAFEFMTPIHFEDGMDFEECECYYASINDGPARSSQRRKPTRRKSVEELKDEVKGVRPSCLRKSSRKNPDEAAKERPPLRRTVSFSGMPNDTGLYAEAVTECMRDSITGPNVTFEEYATVATIYAIDDYPEDVRSSVWMSREELSRCMRRAMIEEMKERREREQVLVKIVEPSDDEEQPVPEDYPQAHAKEVHMMAMATDGYRNDIEYTTQVETIPMAMCDIVLSQ